MTLLLAPFDVSRRPSAATWKLRREQDRRRSGKFRHPRRSFLGLGTEHLVSLWTLLGAVLVILVPLILSNKPALFFSPSSDQENDKRANRASLEILFDSSYALEASPAFPLEETFLAPVSLASHEVISSEAKSLLSSEDVVLLDALQSTTLPLSHAVKFNLGSLTLAENLTSPLTNAERKKTSMASRLARITVYWPEEGDFYTRIRKSSTGTRLRDGHCAVDPKVIPYGSVVNVPGVGRLVAVDTGEAVVSRRAARSAAQTREQRKAIVIDVFCSTRAKAKALIKRVKHFAVVTWQRPEQIAEL